MLSEFVHASKTIGYYRKVYDKEYRNNHKEYNSMASSGDGRVYYFFSYILDGTICMYEATKDTKYLERALIWAEKMVSQATIIDKNGNRNWSGEWNSPYSDVPISYQLYDVQGSTGIAWLARIILNEPALKNRYGSRAEGLYDFVHNEIVKKWFYKRNSLSWHYMMANNKQWPYSDKIAMMLRILNNVHLISGNADYKKILSDLSHSLKHRFESYKDALIWDLEVRFPEKYGGNTMDTSHGNRYPYTVLDLYKAGIVFTHDDVKGLSRLLTKVVWNQSYSDPRFTNFIDGTNGQFKTDNEERPPWGVGQICSGWIGLGEYDMKVQEIGHAVLVAMVAGKKNPSLEYMNNMHGKVELAGHLAKNLMARKVFP